MDVLDNYGRSGLWLAASHGFTDCVRMLLRNGLRPLLDTPANAGPTETRGRTPLLIAAMHGHTEVRIKVLKVSGALPLLFAGRCWEGALHPRRCGPRCLLEVVQTRLLELLQADSCLEGNLACGHKQRPDCMLLWVALLTH